MKTFDEAVRPVLGIRCQTEREDFVRKYHCLTEDVKHSAVVNEAVNNLMREVRTCCAVHATDDVRASLRAMFHFGVATGIEMEKSE